MKKHLSELAAFFHSRGIALPEAAATLAVEPKSLANAGANTTFFVKDAAKLPAPEGLRECLVIVPDAMPDDVAQRYDPSVVFVRTDDTRTLYFDMVRTEFTTAKAGSIDPSARIHESAVVGKDVVIHPNVVIGPDCVIGDRTELRPGVVLSRAIKTGCDCLIQSYAVIGEEGFGLYQDANGVNQLIPHVGGVIIGDRVLIGATTIICSGTLDPTRIGNDTKIDDNTFIAHNCILGDNVVVVANVQISGSVTVGDGAWIAPASSILNQLTIGSNSMVGLGSVVMRDVEENLSVAGNPARAYRRMP